MIVEHSVNIKRPVADVFAYLVDQRNAMAWREGVVSIERLSPGDELRGASFRQVVKTPMWQGSATYDVTAVVPNERIEFQVTSGSMRPHGILRISPSPDGSATTLTYLIDTKARGVAALLEQGFSKLLQHLNAKSAGNVKSILEKATKENRAQSGS